MSQRDKIFDKIIDRREAVYESAIRSLAKYKFWMFGYYAAAWVKYNELLKDTPWHQGNPFKLFVDQAVIERGELDSARAFEIEQAKRVAHARGDDDPALMYYVSEDDGCHVIHVDTPNDWPENEDGPNVRIYLNDDAESPLFNNPVKMEGAA